MGMGGVTVRILGIPVSIGWGLVFLVAMLGFLARRSGVFLVEWVAVGSLAILLHELGHALTFRRFGVPSRITFWGLGGFTIPGESAAALSHGRQFLVSAAGPAVGVVLGGAVLLARPLIPDDERFVRVLVSDWIFVNLGWAIFNLLPIASLDGGRALQHLLGTAFGNRGYVAGLVLCMAIGVAITVAAVVVGAWLIAFIAAFFGVVAPLATVLERPDSVPWTPGGSAAPPRPPRKAEDGWRWSSGPGPE